jgi:hypothetical protein
MNLLKRLACFTAALALTLALTSQRADAGAFAGRRLAVDLTNEASAANDAKVNNNAITTTPPASGAQITIQLFMDGGAGSNTIGWDVKFLNTANVFSDNWTVNSMSGIVSQLGVSATGATAGTIAATAVPANFYLATITLTAKRAIPEGTKITVASVAITDGSFATDSLNVSSAILTFQTPAGPALAAAPALATIPRGGSVSSVVTLSNIASGNTIAWTVTKTSGTATVSVTGQTALTFNTTASGTSASITVNATGAGSAAVTVAATVNGTAVTPSAAIVFSEQVPAELSAFGGEAMDAGVLLNWTTVSQTNNAGWRVMRSTDGETYEAVSDLITGAGTSDALLPYSFVDQNPPKAEQAWYRLDQIDLDGTINPSKAIEVILGARFLDLPTQFSSNVYPNPFNPSTTVAYELPSEAKVSIVIYDALGQEVRRLVSEDRAAGRYTAQWDARDNLGRTVGSGVYIAKIEAGPFSASQKMLLLK